MAQYIDKDQVIEWIKQRLLPTVTNGNYDDWEKGADNERINFLSFINSLPEYNIVHDSSEISMTDKVQLIKQEIEKRMNNLWYLIPEGEKVLKDDFTKDDANNLGKYTALESLLQFIDSIQEPASEDLEEEIDRYYSDWQFDDDTIYEDMRDICRHFAEWQKQQIIKDAIDATILDIDAQTVELGLWPEKLLDIKEGDKVKIIIVKENG